MRNPLLDVLYSQYPCPSLEVLYAGGEAAVSRQYLCDQRVLYLQAVPDSWLIGRVLEKNINGSVACKGTMPSSSM